MLKLEIDTLAVESFPTTAAAGARGTVNAAQDLFAAYNDTECPSGASACPILSCGSSCEPICPAGPANPDTAG